MTAERRRLVPLSILLAVFLPLNPICSAPVLLSLPFPDDLQCRACLKFVDMRVHKTRKKVSMSNKVTCDPSDAAAATAAAAAAGTHVGAGL